MNAARFDTARALRRPVPQTPSVSQTSGLRCLQTEAESSFAFLGVAGAGPEATLLSMTWSEVVDPVNLSALGAEAAPTGSITVLLAGLPEAELVLEPDELRF